MYFEHEVIFIPSKRTDSSSCDSRSITIQTSQEQTTETIKERARYEVVNQGIIDKYAFRNYWTIAGGETRVVDVPWDSVNNLRTQLQGINQVTKVNYRNNNIENIISMALDKDCIQTVKNKITSRYGTEIPVRSQGHILSVYLAWRWSQDYEFALISGLFE